MNDKNRRAKYLIKNIIIFAIGSIATKLISFFLVPLYTNVLSTSQYGTVDLVNTVCTVLAPIIILNISEGVMRYALDKNVDHTKILSIGLLVFIGAVFGGLLIIPVSQLFKEIAPYALYVYFYTITLAGSQLFLCYLRGKEKLTQYALGNILQTTSIAVFNIMYLDKLHQGITGYFKAYIWACSITMIYAFIVGDVKEVIRKFHIDTMLAKEMAKYSVVLIPNTFMWWIMNSSDRVMVTAMIGVAANGIYAISYKVPSLVSVFTGIFNQAWGYSAIRENDSKDRDEYTSIIYKKVVGISVISGVGLLAIMKPFLKIYVEDSFYEAWKYTPYLIVGNVFLTLATFLATSYTVNKDSKGYLFSATTGALVNVIMNFLLIPWFGISGAAFATCLSYFIVFLYRVIDIKKYIKLDIINIKHLIAYFILILAAATMFWDNVFGAVILWVELVIEIVIFSDIWVPFLMGIMRKIRGNRCEY